MHGMNPLARGAVVLAAVVPVALMMATPTEAAPFRPRPRPTPTPTATAAPPPSPPAAVRLAPGSVSPAVITGGDGAVQTVNLTGPAPAGGVDVYITASDVVYTASAGSTVHVPAGATSVSFPFRLSAPATDTVRSLWAQVTGVDLMKIAEVTVLAADPAVRAVTALEFSPDSAVLGGTSIGTVRLKNPAPAGGIAVGLWSNTSYGPGVYVPPYVLVPAGAASATFPALVTRVDEPSVVRPSAHLGTSSASAPLVVVPNRFAVGGAVVSPGRITESAVGIGTAPNPTGVTVTLSTDVAGMSVPATVTIPAGVEGVAFPVSAADSIPLGTVGTITATWNGVSVSNAVFIG